MNGARDILVKAADAALAKLDSRQGDPNIRIATFLGVEQVNPNVPAGADASEISYGFVSSEGPLLQANGWALAFNEHCKAESIAATAEVINDHESDASLIVFRMIPDTAPPLNDDQPD